MPGAVCYKEVTIAAGATGLSDEADLTGFRLIAIQMPATWVAANLTFQARPGKRGTAAGGTATNETLQNVYNDAGTEVTVTAAASRYITLVGSVLDALFGVGAVKVRSGTAATAVDQTASRVLTLVLIPLGA